MSFVWHEFIVFLLWQLYSKTSFTYCILTVVCYMLQMATRSLEHSHPHQAPVPSMMSSEGPLHWPGVTQEVQPGIHNLQTIPWIGCMIYNTCTTIVSIVYVEKGSCASCWDGFLNKLHAYRHIVICLKMKPR